jgi:hypothetical protein
MSGCIEYSAPCHRKHMERVAHMKWHRNTWSMQLTWCYHNLIDYVSMHGAFAHMTSKNIEHAAHMMLPSSNWLRQSAWSFCSHDSENTWSMQLTWCYHCMINDFWMHWTFVQRHRNTHGAFSSHKVSVFDFLSNLSDQFRMHGAFAHMTSTTHGAFSAHDAIIIWLIMSDCIEHFLTRHRKRMENVFLDRHGQRIESAFGPGTLVFALHLQLAPLNSTIWWEGVESEPDCFDGGGRVGICGPLPRQLSIQLRNAHFRNSPNIFWG